MFSQSKSVESAQSYFCKLQNYIIISYKNKFNNFIYTPKIMILLSIVKYFFYLL